MLVICLDPGGGLRVCCRGCHPDLRRNWWCREHAALALVPARVRRRRVDVVPVAVPPRREGSVAHGDDHAAVAVCMRRAFGEGLGSVVGADGPRRVVKRPRADS